MIEGILAVIPARKGSKQLPRKNLAPLAGRPLIAWTIAAAQDARAVGRDDHSPDSHEIADVALQLGAEVPFIRPTELAGDAAASLAVLIHAVGAADPRSDADWVALFQPTSPLRTAADIDAAAALAGEHVDAVISVGPCAPHPWLAKCLGPDGKLTDFYEHPPARRRQEMPLAWALNGAIYLVRRRQLDAGGGFYGGRTVGYPMPAGRSLDIDTAEDLARAEWLLDARPA